MTTLTQEKITFKKSEMEIYAHYLSTGIAVANISNHPNLYQMGLLEGFAVYIGRYADPLATEKVKLIPIPKWANPYLMDRWDGERDGNRPTVLRKYLAYFLDSPELVKDSRKLMGNILFCHCKSATLKHYNDPNYRCHGDILMASAKGIDLNRYSKNIEELWEF
jgi:hypothetical protein